jgi:putative endonuclease
MSTKAFGDWGEQAAAAYLQKRAYRILALQYRAPVGEIDIVAEKADVLVFVEVKTRRSLRYGIPAQAVGYYKQQKIIRTAEWYVQQEHLEGRLCRFDVIEVYKGADGVKIRQFEGAFETGG